MATVKITSRHRRSTHTKQKTTIQTSCQVYLESAERVYHNVSIYVHRFSSRNIYMYIYVCHHRNFYVCDFFSFWYLKREFHCIKSILVGIQHTYTHAWRFIFGAVKSLYFLFVCSDIWCVTLSFFFFFFFISHQCEEMVYCFYFVWLTQIHIEIGMRWMVLRDRITQDTP